MMDTKRTFALGLPNAFPYGEPSLDFLRFAERAEALGYDGLWAGDHVVFHIPRYEIFTTLAAVAARTERVTIGPGVLLLCLRNPVHVAQSIAALDRISNGRFLLGVGVGGEHAKEFAVSGVSARERGARTDEALDVVRRLLTEPEVTHEGRFWKLAGISMKPRPARRPAVWIGGRAEAALRRVVARGDVWFPGWVTPERYRAGLATIEDLCRDAGRDPTTVGRALYLFVNAGRDGDRAREEALDFLSRNYAIPAAPFARFIVAGTPQECVAGMRRYLDAGAVHVNVRFASPDPLAKLELWTTEVLPALRR